MKKHPVYILGLACLGLFFLSMIAWCLSDSEQKETWIEQSDNKVKKRKLAKQTPVEE